MFSSPVQVLAVSVPPSSALLVVCRGDLHLIAGFHVRHHTHQPLCAETASSQEHNGAQSAMLKRGCQRLCLLVLAAAVSRQSKVLEPSHLLPALAAAAERACPTGQGRGSKLVTEDWKPVGSGRFRDLAQDPRGVLGKTLFLFPFCSEEGGVAKTRGPPSRLGNRACPPEKMRSPFFLRRACLLRMGV
jgi:hypothetical protein